MASSDDAIKNLEIFIKKGLTEEIEKALNKSCLIIETSAKEKCPVDSGTLRRSIKHDVDGTTGVVGTNMEYAPYVEIGTGIYSSEGTGRMDAWKYQTARGGWVTTEGQQPQPFLKPAMEENKSKILDCFKGII